MTANRTAPPGPKGHFLVGNLLEFGRDPLGFFERCAREYGNVVSLRIGRWPALFLNHPEHVETVLLSNNRNFIKHTFFWRHVTEIFGKGLVTNEGAPWLRQRRLMQPAFHREKIAGYGRAMVGYTERMLEEWDSAAGAERDVHDDMMRLTMAIATKTLFGADMSERQTAEIGRAFDDAVVEIANRFRRPVKIPSWLPLPSNRRYAAAVRSLDRLVYETVEKKNAEGGGDDLLTMLMEARPGSAGEHAPSRGRHAYGDRSAPERHGRPRINREGYGIVVEHAAERASHDVDEKDERPSASPSPVSDVRTSVQTVAPYDRTPFPRRIQDGAAQ